MTAQAVRDLVTQVVRTMLTTERPPVRYATVVSIDRTNRKVTVTYIGESTTATVSMGSIQPLATGQVVRIGGMMGDRYVEDVLGDSNFGWRPGDMKMYAGAATGVTPQIGWLVADGTAVSRTTYADLFAAIGTKYGVGDGTTTFNLPGGTGSQVPIGIPITQNTRAANVTSAGQSANHTHTFTSGGPSADHTHTGTSGTQSANHTHAISFNSGANSANHTHNVDVATGNNGTSTKTTTTQSANHTHLISGNTGANSANHTHTTTTGGASVTHTHSGTTDGPSVTHTHDLVAMSVTYLIKY